MEFSTTRPCWGPTPAKALARTMATIRFFQQEAATAACKLFNGQPGCSPTCTLQTCLLLSQTLLLLLSQPLESGCLPQHEAFLSSTHMRKQIPKDGQMLYNPMEVGRQRQLRVDGITCISHANVFGIRHWPITNHRRP